MITLLYNEVVSIKEIIIAFIFFTFLTLIFFYKIFLGLIPLPTDLIVGAYHPWINYKWGNYIVGVPVQNPKLSDAVSLYYPFKSLVAEIVKQKQLPLWNPYMFGGYPLFANVQVGSLFPTMIFYLIFSSPIAWTLQIMAQPLLASFFMYLLLRHFRLEILSSIFGGIVYGFGGFTILWVQWNTQAVTSMFLPILILLEDKYLISRKLKWGILFSIFLCIQILAGYLPIICFTLVALVIWYIFKTKRFIPDPKVIFFIVLGASLSAIFLFPAAELIRISQRVVETLGTGSPFISLQNLITLIAPDFFGNDATGNFWGSGDHMDFTLYGGITALIFALIGVKHYWNNFPVKFAFLIFITTLVIVVENPLSVFLYKLGLWGGSSITMNRANFLINFSLSVLGAYGISLIRQSPSKLSLKPGIWIFSIASGITIGLLISRYILMSNANADLEIISHINISLKNLILPIILIITVTLLILLTKKTKLPQSTVILVFIIVLIFELFRFGLKFNTFSSPNFIYPETPISNYLKKYPYDRFTAEKDVFPANMWLPYKLSSIAGYDGVYPLKTAKLLASANSGRSDTPPQPRWGILENFDSKIVDESNVRFIVAVKRDNNGKVSEMGKVSSKLKLPKYKEVFGDKGVVILENTQTLPRAYLTSRVIKASDKEALELMLDNSFPIRTTSISDFEFNSNSNEDLKENLTYEQITNSHILIKASANIDSYLVVLDSFYPGWKAFIDGKETVIHKTNYNFRGLVLPKGDHIVEFKYAPNSLKAGAIISGISVIIIILLLMLPRFFNQNTNKR